MNDHDANAERVRALGASLDDAMLDAINALPPEQRPAACENVRDALAGAPTVKHSLRIPVDLRAQIAAEAERRGPPWTFSSVAVAAMRAGLAQPEIVKREGEREGVPADREGSKPE